MPKQDGILIPYSLAILTVCVPQLEKSIVLLNTNQTDIARHRNSKSPPRILSAFPSRISNQRGELGDSFFEAQQGTHPSYSIFHSSLELRNKFLLSSADAARSNRKLH